MWWITGGHNYCPPVVLHALPLDVSHLILLPEKDRSLFAVRSGIDDPDVVEVPVIEIVLVIELGGAPPITAADGIFHLAGVLVPVRTSYSFDIGSARDSARVISGRVDATGGVAVDDQTGGEPNEAADFVVSPYGTGGVGVGDLPF